MNNNKTTAEALEGVFQRTKFLNVGTKDNPVEFKDVKEALRPSYKGKQFVVPAPKEGHTNDAFFEKKHLWISEGDKYADRWKYSETQTEKKKGFLTSDFSKRDEFSNTIRTLQYREQLKQESAYAKKALELMGAAGTSSLAQEMAATAASSTSCSANKPALYDLVFEEADRNAQPFSKTHRETRNPTLLSKERQMGGLATTAAIAFAPPQSFAKPEFARKPLIRDTFFRRTNAFFNDAAACSTPSS